MSSKEQRALLYVFVIQFLLFHCHGQSNCRNSYYGTSGNITSPNYPFNYNNGANCSNIIYASSVSVITLTVQFLRTELCCDWVELSCRSHSVGLPVRISGVGTINLSPISFSPCQRASVQFWSDSSIVNTGFLIRYQVTPLANSTVTTGAPSTPCPSGCSTRYIYPSYSYCSCQFSTTMTTAVTCPPGCYLDYDFYGHRSCHCDRPSQPPTCLPGCYRTTDYRGEVYCSCPTATTPRLTCSFGCFVEMDFFGHPYCNCRASTLAPLWCAAGCTQATDVYGGRYCRCTTTATTTFPPATGCNQRFRASTGIITSPNYPNSYARGIDCYQYIDVQAGNTIVIDAVDIDLYSTNSYYCSNDYVEIVGCDDSTRTICTSSGIPMAGLSFSCTRRSTVTVHFHSNQYYYSYGYRGFKLSYTIFDTSAYGQYSYYVSEGNSGYIKSPNYPLSFPGYSKCTYNLYAYGDIRITISFDILSLGDSRLCQDTYLKLTCQSSPYTSETVCGNDYPAPKTFDCKTLQIQFSSTTNTSYTQRYFSLRYGAVSTNVVANQDLKFYIGLGAGIGGFLLLVIIIGVIIHVTKRNHRGTARREQQRLDDLTILYRSINGPRAGDDTARDGSHGYDNFSSDNRPSADPGSRPPPYEPASSEERERDLVTLQTEDEDEALITA